MAGNTTERAAKTSAWLLYTLIVLEILFMVSPFAAYYYAVYATPLNALQDNPQTAWLTMYLLPHFSYSDSWLANGLVLVSWPLIFLGAAIFVMGFCQIYWSKFTRRGAVEAGLYRHIRHPQYLALAIVGLGASLYWSRYIVVIAFVTMLYIYVFLARVEERICLDQFGDSYREYMDRTGMFLPRRFEKRWLGFGERLPRSAGLRSAALVGGFVLVLAITVNAGHLLRDHVVGSLQVVDGPERVTVFIAPVSERTEQAIVDLLSRADLPGSIAYVAPASWRIPELGFEGTGERNERGGMSELLHPTTHGNALSFDERSLSVLLADVRTATDDVHGIERFTKALDVRPVEFAELDAATPRILARRAAGAGDWSGIPVPTF